jgi:pimeloyl-ACP methyl ester carboxylesterase
MRPSAPLALLAVMGCMLLFATPAGATIAYVPCAAGAVLQCGALDVPLDRSGAVPGTVRLAAARLPAPANPTHSAVVALVGGPGQAALPFVTDFATVLAPALATRDLLMFDQRGTGRSSPIACRLRDSAITADGTRCATALGAARGQYTTAASVEDIEALRAQSGYEKLVIYGVSYGTKVALDYAARHPTRVEALVLDSVVLPQGVDALQRSTFAAMRRVLNDVCAGGVCHGISRNPSSDLANRVRSLARRDLTGILTSSRGRRQRVRIDRDDLFSVVLGGDLNPTLRAELPGALTSARRGDTAPLIRLAARSAGIINLRRQAAPSEFSDGVFAATLCEETIFPWARGAPGALRAQQAGAYARALPGKPFSPFDATTALTSQQVGLCIGWPNATAGFAPAGPLPNLPTLVISGASDIRTPFEDAAVVKALIPAAQFALVPFTGHSTLSGDLSPDACATRAVRQFFAGEAVAPCAPTTPAANPYSPTPVAPTRFENLRATGRRGKIGRTITAALRTATDIRRQAIGDALEAGQVPTRIGGLRGGRVVVRNRRLTLFDVVLVPGVQVSGSVPMGAGRQVLRLRGRKAARGTIVVTGTSISGHLGGRVIRLTARAASVAADGDERSLRALLRHFRLRTAGSG